MEISHNGNSFIHTPTRKLELCNVLHVPKATKNLMSVHRYALDNNVFFEFTLGSFLSRIRTRGPHFLREDVMMVYILCELLILSSSSLESISGIIRWHGHLGHPSFQIFKKFLEILGFCLSKSQIKILFVVLVNKQRVINFPIPSLLVCLAIL
jgi:hypothetical protein